MEDQVKISAGLIIRDEASTLEACLASIRPHVDEIVVVDTGSVDNSMEIARKYADKVELFLDCNDEQGRIADFAMARQRSMDLCSHPWFFWCDGDDVVVGAEHLRSLAEQASQYDNFHWLLAYEYTHDASGKCTSLQWRERLLGPKHRYQWTSPVHEICVPVQPVEGTLANGQSDLVRLIHRKEHSSKPLEEHRNLRILRDYVGRVGEADPRALYYLGQESAMAGDVPTSLSALKRYLDLGSWDDERCHAMLSLSSIYRTLGDLQASIDWALKALTEKSWPEPYLELARTYYEYARAGTDARKNWHRVSHFCELALQLQNPSPLLSDPLIKGELHRYLSTALGQLGQLDRAAVSCEAALQVLPDDADLQHNLGLYKAELARKAVAAGLDQLGLSEPQKKLIGAVLSGELSVTAEAPTGGIHNVNTPENEPEKTKPHHAASFLDLVFYAGHALEPWNPVTLEAGGMGGSETMLWNMAKRLRALGHRVRVYGHATRSMEGTFEGVEWFDASRYKNLKCDVLITSRRPDAVDDTHNVEAGARILWVHDIHVGESLDANRDIRIDRILCLSEWHKDYFSRCYPRCNPQKILVTRNGVDLKRFDHKVERNPKRVVYSSSPDRGLLNLLSCWPAILKEEPEAELHTYYGFGNWEKAAEMNQDRGQLAQIRHLKNVLKATPRVHVHDRVNGQELAIEFLKSGVWAYPTWFSETSCITAMEAQVAGLHVVTTSLAALKETVKHGVLLPLPMKHGATMSDVQASVASKEYLEPFTSAVVEALRFKSTWTADTQFSLDTLAAEWSQLLNTIHHDVSEAVMPPFSEAPEASL